MNKTVVTGGLGFIGFHLCQHLLEEGVETIIIDDRSGAGGQEDYEEKIGYFGRNALFTDLEKKMEQVSPDTFDGNPDVIFHLAGPVTTDIAWQSLHQKVKVALCQLKAAVGTAKETGARLVVVSSTDVYGGEGRISETSGLDPETALGVVYIALETYLKKAGIPTIILRVPEVYGPGQPKSGSFHQLLDRTNKNDVKVKPASDVIFVGDVVKALMSAAASDRKFDIYNITSGKNGEWYKGKRIITGECMDNSGAKIFYSNEKAKEQLGFNPETAIETGIECQIDHFKRRNN